LYRWAHRALFNCHLSVHVLTSDMFMCSQANEDELNARYAYLPTVLQVGHDLIKADNFGSEKIQNRIDSIEEQWKNLMELANFRRRRLMEAVDFYQVPAGCVCNL